MNLNQLRVFHSAANLQSFSRAAEALCLTQPGISKHIRRLEEYYGVKLFDRLGKRVALTRAGEILFDKTAVMFEQLKEAKAQIDDMTDLAAGRMNIGASVTAGVYILPRLLGHFLRLHPSIEIATDISPSEEIEEKVLSNTLDLGLVGHQVADERLSVHRFLTDELVVIVPPDHVWARRKVIQARQLADQPFLVASEGSGTRKITQERLSSAGITLRRVIEFGNTECVKKAVEAGLGVSILSKHVVAREVASGWIQSIRISGLKSRRDFYVIYRADKYLSSLVEAFLSHINKTRIVSQA